MTQQGIDQWTPHAGLLQQKVNALVREAEAQRLAELRCQLEPQAVAELRAEHEAELERRAARERESQQPLKPGQFRVARRLARPESGRPDLIVESTPIWTEGSDGRVRRGVKPPPGE